MIRADDPSSARRDLEDAATHLGRPHDLRFQPMFGGLMAYLAGKPCAWLRGDVLALKLAPADQPAMLAFEGSARMVAKPGAAPSRQYIVVPRMLRRDTAQLAQWLERTAHATPP